MIGSDARWFCITADSVSSTIMRSGESPNDSIVSSTVRIAVGCQNTGGRLTDTYRSSPMLRHTAPWRQASLMTHSEIGAIMPVRSASGMKELGMTMPRSPSAQRISASTPTTSLVVRSTSGW